MKKLIMLLLTIILLVPTGVSAANNLSIIKVYVDGEQLVFDIDPIQTEGTTLVQFTTVFKALGLQYSWDQKTKTVTGYNDDITLKLTIGNKTAIVNGEKVTLLVAPKVVNGNTLIPLRFVSEATGADVEWNKDTRTITIESFYIPLVFETTTLSDAAWGMTMKQVKAVEYGKLFSSDTDYLFFGGIYLAGYDAVVEYTFANNKLGRATYYLNNYFEDNMDYIYATYDLYYELEAAFGEPILDVEYWAENIVEEVDFEKYGESLVAGDLDLVSVWKLEDTEIALITSLDDDGEPYVSIISTGLKYFQPLFKE
ncbi:copper amine oxidase N-terminal domain-containing protein [Paenibacillus endoradicis]|uniref:copper amine oxidase N-terminal domain-containing protein n=1 Tax=Paenibacillus endoradicis TaxID=2972487 RepID=UPI00215981DA|nr:copper amine oxidase N-terminal domain-containing protein [Paenibacillus endoradicis]MCR8659515.1 copper amine oxidase N-terminal domain-containing protein [Paenibacillus endoradicis]